MLVSFNYCFLTGIVILLSLLFLKRLQPNFFRKQAHLTFPPHSIFLKKLHKQKAFNNRFKLAVFLRYLSLFTCQNLQRRTLICFSSAPLAFSEKTQFAFCFATHDMSSRAREEHASMREIYQTSRHLLLYRLFERIFNNLGRPLENVRF